MVRMRPCIRCTLHRTCAGAALPLGSLSRLRLDEDGIVHGEVYRCEDINGSRNSIYQGVDADAPDSGLYLRMPVRLEQSRLAVGLTYAINRLHQLLFVYMKVVGRSKALLKSKSTAPWATYAGCVVHSGNGTVCSATMRCSIFIASRP